jgi:hypothetical protein
MEADWEVEIGSGAPILDAHWPGFVDLRRFPERVCDLEEASLFPALSSALLRLNGPDSHPESSEEDGAGVLSVWTSKCDVWRLGDGMEQCDPDEMGADPLDCVVGVACYIDLLPRERVTFAEINRLEEWVRTKVERIRQMAAHCCRADLVIRRAFVGEQDGLGVTAYLSACGATRVEADEALSCALAVFAKAVN